MKGRFYLHLVSDATGTTLQGLARACIAQFDGAAPTEKFWTFIRTPDRLEQVIEGLERDPGPVLFTLVEDDLRETLRQACARLGVPCIPVLDPVLQGFADYLDSAPKNKPGIQYELNAAYFERIDAVDFAIHHDDGQNLETVGEAGVILVGASRTSKTPTCFYLANRGIRAANIPLVPAIPVPLESLRHEKPLYVGLIETPERLVELRRNRLKSGEVLDHRVTAAAYLEIDAVEEEIRQARRLFSSHGWPVIDVTRRSVEETAAEILTLFYRHHPDRMLI